MKFSLDNDLFVGREREMQQLTSALERAITGHGQMVMLVGEPGIGKTRAAQELVDLARAREVATLWGRCSEERGAPPHWPWIQVIQSHIEDLGSKVAQSVLASSAGPIAAIVPGVPHAGPWDVTFHTPDDPDEARFQLHDAITSFLVRSSQNKPLLVILDDLHWADQASLRLLEFVAQGIVNASILITGTYRDVDVTRGHPLIHTLGELTRQRLFKRVLLKGLDVEAVRNVVEAHGGAKPSSDLAVAVHTQTGGNPLFVGEMARFLFQEGHLGPDTPSVSASWDFRLPDGIREVIGRRLDRLSGASKDVLNVAAVIGRQFNIIQLSAVVTDVSRDELIEALDEAMRIRVVEDLRGETGLFQFTHALIQQTIREELTLTGRVRMHALIAETLERMYGEQAEDHAAELALHFAEAELALGTDRLITYSVLAGEQASRELAFEAAVAHFETALEAVSEVPMNEMKARALTGYGISQGFAANMGKGLDALNQAFDFYIATGDYVRAIQVTRKAPTVDATDPETARRTLQALEIVEPGSTDEAFLLHTYEMAAEGVPALRDLAKQDDLHNRALEIARSNADENLVVQIMSGHCSTQFARGELRAGLIQAEAALDLVDGRTQADPERNAAMWAACMAGQLGEPVRAKRHSERAMAAARRTGSRYRLLNTIVMGQSSVSDALGEFDAVVSDQREASHLVPGNVTRIGGYVKLFFAAAAVEFERGNSQQGSKLFDSAVKFVRSGDDPLQTLLTIPRIVHTARLTGDPDRLALAKEWLAMIDASVFSIGYSINEHLARALFASEENDPAAARSAYAHLQELPTQMGHYGHCSERIAGLAARTMGEQAIAAHHFDAALEFCRAAGYKPELAWTNHDFAEMLLGEPRSIDRQMVDAMLQEGLRVSSDLGMTPLEERLRALQSQLTAGRVGRHAYPDSLTEREAEVLKLLAAGMTNREIAGELVLSERTVQRHIANLYPKITVRNRVQATAYALRHSADLQ